MTSINSKVDTDSAEAPDKGVGCGAIVSIFLTAGRKQWHHELPPGWREAAWERFDYIECGIFQKSADGLTNRDRDLLVSYGERPEGWIEPHANTKVKP